MNLQDLIQNLPTITANVAELQLQHLNNNVTAYVDFSDVHKLVTGYNKWKNAPISNTIDVANFDNSRDDIDVIEKFIAGYFIAFVNRESFQEHADHVSSAMKNSCPDPVDFIEKNHPEQADNMYSHIDEIIDLCETAQKLSRLAE